MICVGFQPPIEITSVVVPGGPHLQVAQFHTMHIAFHASHREKFREICPLEMHKVFVSDIAIYESLLKGNEHRLNIYEKLLEINEHSMNMYYMYQFHREGITSYAKPMNISSTSMETD